jgi:hypothetical protein
MASNELDVVRSKPQGPGKSVARDENLNASIPTAILMPTDDELAAQLSADAAAAFARKNRLEAEAARKSSERCKRRLNPDSQSTEWRRLIVSALDDFRNQRLLPFSDWLFIKICG